MLTLSSTIISGATYHFTI